MSPQPNESGLCLSCGLCCNGVLFGRVPVEQNDDVASLEAAGIALSSGGGREIGLPCPAHDGQCRVYANRPTACREYRCDLLQRAEDGRIDSAEALRIVGEAVRLERQLVQAVRDIEPADGGWTSRARLLKQFTERLDNASEPETRRRLGRVVVQILGFDGFLRRHFGASVLEWSEPAVDRESRNPGGRTS